MVTVRNDIELTMTKDVTQRKYTPSAPQLPPYRGGQRKPPRQSSCRCTTIVALVVLFVLTISAGTVLFYERLVDIFQSPRTDEPFPKIETTPGSSWNGGGGSTIGPEMIDPYSPSSSSSEENSSTTSTTTEGTIYIDVTPDGEVEPEPTSEDPKPAPEPEPPTHPEDPHVDHSGSGSGDDVTRYDDSDSRESSEETGDRSGDGSW